jgi:catechol 2,3-dioxygenase
MNRANTAMIPPYRLGHLNLFVTNVEASAKFYSDVCGFQVVFREPGISMIFMSNGNTHHDLGLMEITDGARVGRDGYVQASSGQGKTPGLNHLGFEMETEQQVVDAYHRAKAGGVKINRTTDHQIAHSIYLSEINGFTFEFYADVTDDWREVYANNVGELISGHWDPDAREPFKERKGQLNPHLHKSDTAALPARNVAYAALPVKDLSASVNYYTNVLGMTTTSLDEKDRIAIMSGADVSGCDVCLVETTETPDVRLLLGGIQMHGGQPISRSMELLRRQGVAATIVGDDDTGALVVVDPDGIPLVYSTNPAAGLMKRFGGTIVAEARRLKAA